jgi:iron(III) transport system substrate-binding protein
MRPSSRIAVLLALAALPPAAASERLVVYSGRAEALIGPLFEKFADQTGIDVAAAYPETPVLATQLLAEASASPADVVVAQEAGYLSLLGARGMLAPLPEALLGQVAPRFRDPQGRWIGTSARVRVMVYNPTRLRPEELPRSLRDVADPRWKGRVGWAPGNASFQAHVSALRHLWGEQATRDWLAAMMANEPAAYAKNSAQVLAVAAGEIDLGWVNHYYLHKLKGEVGGQAANASFANPGDAGNLLMISGAAVVTSTRRPEAALALVSFLVSEQAERYFAQETFEYPTRPGIDTHPDIPPLDGLKLAEVDPVFLADLEPALTVLRSLGLQ